MKTVLETAMDEVRPRKGRTPPSARRRWRRRETEFSRRRGGRLFKEVIRPAMEKVREHASGSGNHDCKVHRGEARRGDDRHAPACGRTSSLTIKPAPADERGLHDEWPPERSASPWSDMRTRSVVGTTSSLPIRRVEGVAAGSYETEASSPPRRWRKQLVAFVKEVFRR